MKLIELMGQFFDETWFEVTTPDGERHMFWNADYLGWHPDVMPELEPLLAREIVDEVLVEIRKDPDRPDVFNAPEVPVVCVGLVPGNGKRKELQMATKEDMVKDRANHVSIERRRGSGHPVWHITMCVEPRADDEFDYTDLVSAAENTLRRAKSLPAEDGWTVDSAEVMAWSAREKTNPDHYGIDTPHSYRITLDIVKDGEDPEED